MRQTILCASLIVFGVVAWGWAKGPSPGREGGGVPPGTIISFAGQEVPEGWLLCDGRPVSKEQYPALFVAIGSAWGTGGDGDGPMFSLPDLRGRFLRGADRGTGRDPDRNQRAAAQQGGNVGDQVGSVQGDATRLPRGLGLSVKVIGCDGRRTCNVMGNEPPDEHSGLAGADRETRPENVYVNWLIKH